MDFGLAFGLILTLAMFAVIVFDARHYIIPNALNLGIFALYPFAAFLLALPWPMALLAGAIVLVVGLAIFSLGLMGGGDIKLLAVLSLYTGWGIATPQFIVLTALFGGLLVAVVVALRLIAPVIAGGRNLPRLLLPKQPIPYGLAIAGAFLFMLWTGQVPGISPL